MRRAFTLAEIMVASVIILVVLTALAVALMSFARGSRSIELQDGALTLARLELAEMERSMLRPGRLHLGQSVHGGNIGHGGQRQRH